MTLYRFPMNPTKEPAESEGPEFSFSFDPSSGLDDSIEFADSISRRKFPERDMSAGVSVAAGLPLMQAARAAGFSQ